MQETGGDQVSRSILLIEDDRDLCSLMKDYFTRQGFRVEAAYDGIQGLARALDEEFNLIVLDVMLPALDGFEVLRQLRKRNATPVIMLTARTARADRIAGLETGADDYLPKSFDPEELLARIRAVLRRSSAAGVDPQIVEVGDIRLNPQTREAWYASEPLDLTMLEFDILDVLVRSAGRVVSRDQLTAALYQRKSTPYERSLDVHISHLRKKLERQDRNLIQTIRGVGYQFSAGTEVRR